MPERVFRAIIPKRDNSDQPIKASALESLASELIERFGGVTVYPAAMGCFKMEEGDVCVRGEHSCRDCVPDCYRPKTASRGVRRHSRINGSKLTSRTSL